MISKMWWDHKYGKNRLCGILHSRLRSGIGLDGLSYCIQLKCKHNFYRKALKKWIETCGDNSKTCPLCRKIFDYRLIV